MTPERLQELLSHPILKKLVELGNDNDFMGAVKVIYESPSKKAFWWTQAVFVVAMTLFRWWRQGEAEGVLAKTWVSLYCLVLVLGATGYLIPYYYFGESYVILMKRMWGLTLALWS